MSFGGFLKGLGKGALGFATGGPLGAIGEVAGSLAQGRATGRQAEAEQLRQQQMAALQAAAFNRQAPSIRAGNSVRGDLLANAQPATFTGSGRDLRLQGGLSPALFSANTRQLGQGMSRQALLSQLGQGGANDPYMFNQAPYAPPHAGKLDKILGGIGLAGSIANLLPFGKPKAKADQSSD